MERKDKKALILAFIAGKPPKQHKVRIQTIINGVKALVVDKVTNAPISINIQVFTNNAKLLNLQTLGANMEEMK